MIKKLILPTILLGVCAFLYVSFNDEISNIMQHPKRYTDFVYNYSKQYKVDENLVYAIIKTESNFFPYAKSKANSKGLMQVSDDTFEYAKTKIDISSNDIYNKQANIQAGIWYLSNLLERFNNNEYYAILAYNAGPENVSKWIDSGFLKDNLDYKSWNIPYAETRIYIDKVENSKKYYENMNSK